MTGKLEEKGFTLIEAVVIIAIIGILGAIAIPNMIGWVPKYRLQNAANDLRAELQKVRMRAIRERSEMAVVFDTANNSYRIEGSDFMLGIGTSRQYTLGDAGNTIRQVSFDNYLGGVGYGRGDSTIPAVDDPLAVPFAANPSYNNSTVVFTPTGLIKNDAAFGGGFVYLSNQRGDAFAIGTPTLAGIVTLRIWDGATWTQ